MWMFFKKQFNMESIAKIHKIRRSDHISAVPVFLLKVGDSYSVYFLIRTPIFEWHAVWCGCMYGYQIDMCLRDWVICSKYDNMSGSIVDIIWRGGGLYNHLMSTRIFTLMVRWIRIWASNITSKVTSIWICSRCRIGHVFLILWKVG